MLGWSGVLSAKPDPDVRRKVHASESMKHWSCLMLPSLARQIGGVGPAVTRTDMRLLKQLSVVSCWVDSRRPPAAAPLDETLTPWAALAQALAEEASI